jgi:hypothetical protein
MGGASVHENTHVGVQGCEGACMNENKHMGAC